MLKDFSQQMAALEQASTQSNTFTATFEISTWLFMQGATEKAVLREQSIKGALRFWWRALYWHEEFLKAESCNELNGDYQKIHNRALSSLHRRESQVWGGLVCKKKAIASPVKLTLVKNETKELKVDKNRVGDGLKYGMGLGVFEPQIGLTRKGLSGGNFSLELEFSNLLNINPECDPTEKPTLPQHRYTLPSLIDEVLLSIVCLSEFGGLGARSRNGFGSVNLLNLMSSGGQNLQPQYRKTLIKLFNDVNNIFKEKEDTKFVLLPPIPAVSKYTLTTSKLIKDSSQYHNIAVNSLKDFLTHYKLCRGTFKDEELSQNTNKSSLFEDANYYSRKNRRSLEGFNFKEQQVPDKYYLGLPIAFHDDISFNIESVDQNDKQVFTEAKRAKQLFVHICREEGVNKSSYFPRLTLFPSWYFRPHTKTCLKMGESSSNSVEISNQRALQLNQKFFRYFRDTFQVSYRNGGAR